MKNSIATAGLVAFLAVDVALVGLALRSGHTTPTALPAASTVTSPDVATSEPTSPEPRPTGSTGSAAKDAVPVKRLISAVDAKTAWRATTGTCSQGKSSIEVTSDGGKTWTKLTSPSRAIARVQMLDSSRVFVIGAGANCELKQYSSRDAGDTWQPPATASGGWARRLDKSSQVLAPQESAATPCGDAVVVDLSRTSADQAEALCADGSVLVTGDGGSTWSDSGDAPGAVALSNLLTGNDLSTYAARIVKACKGVQLVTVVKGKTPDVVDCIPVGDARPGAVGLSVTDSGAWLVAGGQTWVSQGDLTSWKQV